MIVKRLKAFTLAELIVVMIISIITLTTIYTVYLLVKKQYVKQSAKIESLTNYIQFKKTFSTDFNNADSVKNEPGNQSLECYVDTSIITYEFLDTKVTRQLNNLVDSFLVFPINPEILHIENSESVIQVSFSVVPFRDTVLLNFNKQYDATFLIKTKPN